MFGLAAKWWWLNGDGEIDGGEMSGFAIIDFSVLLYYVIKQSNLNWRIFPESLHNIILQYGNIGAIYQRCLKNKRHTI